MADYTSRQFTLVRSTGTPVQEFTGVTTYTPAGWGGKIFNKSREQPIGLGNLQAIPRKYVVNRGRNTGGGAAYVYWLSPNNPDPNGYYYNGAVPWGQIADVIGVGTTYPQYGW